MCRAQSVGSGSTLRIGSRHFSQSVFLHVKWPARNLSINDHSVVQQKSSRKDQVVLQQRVTLVKNHTCPASLDMVSELSARNGTDLAD